MTASAFLISLAALLLEIAATRLLAVIQWYHYAFMILGLALLGYGAGGTLLVLRPGWARTPATAAWSAAAFGPAAALSYLALNRVPFDAYRLAVEPRQALYLGVQFAALGLPFLCAGLCVGALLAAAPRRAGAIYGASLIGSGAGALAAWVVMEWAGAPAAAAVAAALGPVAAVLGPAASDPVVVPGSAGALSPRGTPEPAGAPAGRYPARWRMTCAVLAAVLAAPAVRPVSLWEVRPSPYKGLNRLLTFPDARVMWTRWNAFSRVDVVASAAIRSAPGMSYLAASAPAPQLALLLDGETAGGIVRGGLSESAFTEALPSSVAYHLRRGPVLVLEAAGGLEVLGALRHGVSPVTLAESNPLVVEAVRRFGGGLLDDPRVRVVAEGTRSYVRRAPRSFQIIQVPMVEGFQVVASGAYSLGETYRLTVEAVRDYYQALAPGGVLVLTRWLQLPPSEEARAWATAVAALEEMGVAQPAAQVAALRSLNTATILIRRGAWTADELAAIRRFAEARRFDLIALPGLEAEEANRFQVLPGNEYYHAFAAILDPARRAAWMHAARFDARPARDDRPFFFHFFRWQQVPSTLAMWGRTWQPFGGGGYLVVLALLPAAALAAAALVLLPWAAAPGARRPPLRLLAGFALLGFGFIGTEIALVQRFILLLGTPTHALVVVLVVLLATSGAGSVLTGRLTARQAAVMPALALVVASLAAALPWLVESALALPLILRIAVAALAIAPPGLLMGMPFALALRAAAARDAGVVAWAWAANGAASVVGALGATIVALSWGLSGVLLLSALAYGGAALAFGTSLAVPGSRAGPAFMARP